MLPKGFATSAETGGTPDVFGIDHGVAWVVSEAPATQEVVVNVTANGGRTWARGSIVTNPFSMGPVTVRSISFLDALQGWVVLQPMHGMGSEPGTLYETSDGGQVWRLVASSGTGYLPFGGVVRFQSSSSGWMVGPVASTAPSELVRTQSGGTSWQTVALPGDIPSQTSVVTPPQAFGGTLVLPVAVRSTGLIASLQFALYTSRDGGHSWRRTTVVFDAPVGAVDVASADTTFVWAGYQENSYAGTPVQGELLATSDGGRTWTRIPATGTLRQVMRAGMGIRALDFVNAQDGWAITGPMTGTGYGPLLVTHDGGATWQVVGETVSG